MTSPVSGSRLRIFSSMPAPPAPAVAEPATSCHGTSSGRKNSSAGLASVILEIDGVLRSHHRGCPADLCPACGRPWLHPQHARQHRGAHSGRLLHGDVPTSVGHQLNREILRLRPDVNAVIHVHHDETIAYFAASPGRELRILSIEFPSVMGRPPHVLPSHVNVELDVAPIRSFIHHTNAIVMEGHGVTTLGRTLSEAYHRLNTLAAEVRRLALAEELAVLRGSEIQYVDPASLEWAYEHADDVIYPTPAAAAAAPR